MSSPIRATGAVMALFTGLFVLPAHAQTQDFATWTSGVRAEAIGRGVSPTIFDEAFAGVVPIERVIELDRSQPEGTISFQTYVDRIVSQSRIDQGRRLLAQHRPLLEQVGAKFGVQPRFIVALWGIETNFGGFTGGFPVIDALATLAYDGRRSDFFRAELLHALDILEQGHIANADMKGSWAGAMGQSQFMPSSFVSYAIDYDGDGAKDIWTTLDDVFASAANFLSSQGWRDDITWGREVRLPTGFDTNLVGLETVKTLPEWQALGVRRVDGTALPGRDLEASIVFPDDDGGRAFIVYENYRTTLKWNRSFYFATSVGILSDRIAGR